MASSIVLELQQSAMEPDTDVSSLLRKALVIATKLKRGDFRSWVDYELNGYRKGETSPKVPPYRKLHGTVCVNNPFYGLQPLFFEDPEVADMFANIEVRDPIAGLIALIDGFVPGKSTLSFPFNSSQETYLLNCQELISPLPPVRTVSANQIEAIIEAVRTAILEWTLKLEEEGILGEGMTFTQAEKEKAMQSQNIRIENFQGIFGNVSQSSVTQHLAFVKKGDLGSLQKYLTEKGVEQKDVDDLFRAVETDGPPNDGKFGEHVSAWMGKMIAKAADGSWQIGVGAAGSLLAEGLKAFFGC